MFDLDKVFGLPWFDIKTQFIIDYFSILDMFLIHANTFSVYLEFWNAFTVQFMALMVLPRAQIWEPW